MKKFELLGRSLSKNQQKKILGGDESVQELGGGTCYATCPNGRRWGLICPECRTATDGFIMCGDTLIDYGCHS